VLYAGTDDGALWVTRDGGKAWSRIDDKLPGLPGPRYISAIVPSHHADGRVYLGVDGHRSNDFDTYLFMSSNYGQTWRSIGADLPARQPVRGFAEDRRNDRLLFVGTESGCYASLDRGRSWLPLGSGLPTTAVHDLKIQDRDAELVAATHGRGIWILDIAPLRQLSRAVVRKDAVLLAPQPAYLWRRIDRPDSGHKSWRAPRAPYGAVLYLYLKDLPAQAPRVEIEDLTGKHLATLTGAKVAGLQRLIWNVRVDPPPAPDRDRRGPSVRGDATPRRGRQRGAPVPPGTYTACFTAQGSTQRQTIELRADPMTQTTHSHPLSRN
jgi:hypothetical protein